tara:strand:+ start:957 stop:1208 length:252 start_codon:yes stop_codon:yes gene_type:complete
MSELSINEQLDKIRRNVKRWGRFKSFSKERQDKILLQCVNNWRHILELKSKKKKKINSNKPFKNVNEKINDMTNFINKLKNKV